MRNFCLALILAFLVCPALAAQPALASTSPGGRKQPAGSSAVPAPGTTTQPTTQPKVTAYTLPPELYQKAHNLGRIHFRFQLIRFVSKRIVVWDTTTAKIDTPQIVLVAGHEMGHYVLKHIPKLLTFFAAILFILLYLGYRSTGWVLSRWGEELKIRGLDDWASLRAPLFLITGSALLANPLASAASRYYEHQADQYGLEVTHGLTPDSGQVAAQNFPILGEVDLDDPDPNPLAVFLFYSHPPIPDRIRFSLT